MAPLGIAGQQPPLIPLETRNQLHALDGEIGHLSDFLIDDESWKIDSALIDTKNWWTGKHVLLPAAAITEIDWAGRYLRVDQTCYKIKSTLAWTASDWTARMEGLK